MSLSSPASTAEGCKCRGIMLLLFAANFTMTSFGDGNDQHPCCKALALKMLPGFFENAEKDGSPRLQADYEMTLSWRKHESSWSVNGS